MIAMQGFQSEKYSQFQPEWSQGNIVSLGLLPRASEIRKNKKNYRHAKRSRDNARQQLMTPAKEENTFLQNRLYFKKTKTQTTQ